ncbi:gp8 [Shigella phage Buco]|uniref:Uncharacterized protein n=1 Tax=Shigella phage Buco TaxID=2530183 RepID=A0A482JG39_9CAUD|nr:gp8 [Shigella phage Buco]QBP32908.1 hypothetical protein HRP29_gp8 [Shigella phage Buco]
MPSLTQDLTPLTVSEVAALYWRMLETESNAGLTWDSYRRIPDELKPLCPCERRLRHVRREDVVLLDTLRTYSPECAAQSLAKLQFPIVAELTTRGYAGAFKAFSSVLRQYYREACAIHYYG